MKPREPSEFIELFSALMRCIRGLAAQSYAGLELGPTQAKFLRHIGHDARISQADLARATVTDPTLTGRALQTLVKRGWVRRQRSAEDKRQYVLELTATGRRLLARVEQEREKIGARVVAELSGRDFDDFERVARKLIAAFEASDEN